MATLQYNFAIPLSLFLSRFYVSLLIPPPFSTLRDNESENGVENQRKSTFMSSNSFILLRKVKADYQKHTIKF